MRSRAARLGAVADALRRNIITTASSPASRGSSTRTGPLESDRLESEYGVEEFATDEFATAEFVAESVNT